MKVCRKCDTARPLGAFKYHADRRRPAGGYYETVCRECCNTEARVLAERKREEREFNRLTESVGTPPCDGCEKRKGCVSECDMFVAYLNADAGISKSRSGRSGSLINH